MVRSDDDTWDIATSVGITAVAVAMARAAETDSANPLIRDEFARPLVQTAQLAQVYEQVAPLWKAPAAGQADSRPVDIKVLIDFMAVRTHFLDAYCTSASQAGIQQHVILAAGLDSRAYRLDWPAHSVVYEIDLPTVLDYKSTTLEALGATPKAIRREVGVDLRHDWPVALRVAGFDHARPTAWLAEGLLPYLPARAKEALFTHIARLSAAGSQVAVTQADIRRPEVREHLNTLRARRGQPDSADSFNPSELWFGEEGQPSAEEWFGLRGWATRSQTSRDELARLGRSSAASDGNEPSFDPFITSFVVAKLPAGTG